MTKTIIIIILSIIAGYLTNKVTDVLGVDQGIEVITTLLMYLILKDIKI